MRSPDWYIKSFEPPKSFYTLEPTGDGYADLTIVGDAHQYDTDAGREYDCETYTLSGVKLYDDLEDDIQEHYCAWLAHARAFTLERAAIRAAIDELLVGARQKIDSLR